MDNETNDLMNQDGYNVNINSENSEQSYFTATTSNGNLRYVPKKWESNELIETIEMNNIEQGVQIALAQTDTIQQTANQAVENVRSQIQTFNTRANEIENELNLAKSSIENDVNSKLDAQNTNLLNALTKLLGSYYTLGTITDNLDSNKSTVDARITLLYDEIFGEGSNGSTSSNSLNDRLKTLTDNVSDLTTTWSNNYTNIDTRITDIDTRITKIYNDIFGNNSSGSNKTIIEQIADLNTAIFGSSDGEDSSGSLIDKIVAVLGRGLPDAEDIPESGVLEDSLTSKIDTLNDLISNILETLGMSEESTNDYTFSDVLTDLYGALIQKEDGTYSRDEHPLIETLINVPGEIYTLNTKVTSVEKANEELSGRITTVEGWKNTIDDVYTDADIIDHLEDDENTYLRLKRKETEKPKNIEEMRADIENTYITLPKGGGGGGATASGTASIIRITEASIQILTGKPCFIEYKLDARDSSGELVGGGTATWFVGGVQVATSIAKNIKSDTDTTTVNNDFDISPYLSVGTNNIILQVSVSTGGEYNIIVRKTWTINVVNFSFIWDYNEETIFNTGVITLEWIPYGANLNKTTHIYIDRGTDHEIYLTRTTLQSGITQTYTFEHNLSHGIHICEIFLTAVIDGKNETTDSQFHDIIILEPSNITPIISSSPLIEIMKKDQEGNFIKDEDGIFIQEMEQYDTVALPIVIYTPNSTLTNNIILKVNGEIVDTWNNINRTVQYWNYSPTTTGEKILTISVDSAVKKIHISVKSVEIENEEVSDYNFKIKASDIISNTDLQNIQIEGQPLIFSSNFDWVNGGLKTERDFNNNIQQYICVKAGTTLTIPYQLFKNNNPALTSTGFNFKIIFKITNCSDYNAEFLDCFLNNIGIKMFAHEAYLSSNTFYTADARLTTQYSEDSYIELEFDIYPQNTDDEGKTITFSFADCWVDGILSSIKLYDASTSFDQSGTLENPYKNIVIGSENCDVYLYLIKSYNKRLSFNDHIANFIADAPNATQMKARYNRNDILDNDEINYERLIEKNGDCRVWLYEIPYMTIGKKDKVLNCTFQQKWGNGNSYFNDLRGKGTMTVQGTSSVKYIKGAANTDINFTELVDGNGNNLMVNGTEDETYGNNWYVADPDNPGHAKIYTVQEGEQLGPECIAVARDSNNQVTQYIKALGYKISENSSPITYSNTKVNFASCEQVNNMCNAAWYQKFNPYPSLTPRDCMEFSIGVQFIKDLGVQLPDADHFRLFPNDNKFHFYSIANMGNSKKNVHVFHDLSNPNEVCIEVNDNDKDQMVMVNDDLSVEDWSGDVYFSMRYPDTKNPSQEIRNAWQRLVSWMAANNPNAATNNPLGKTVHFDPYTFKGHNRAGAQVLKGTTVNQYAGDYTTDSFEYRMAKMLSECEDYMVMDSFVYHFLYLERHTMVDNVSKNNFWSSTDLIHWDLSKAYDMDTSDGNNNQGAFEFDYGNEYNDDRTGGGGKVFNGARSVWFVFIANLKEACSTMFTNREALGAWSSIAYQNFLNTEQQKIPERIWNACYKYDYIRTYPENDWINFLAGGKKTHQRKHYEYFEELYDSSKYRGTVSTSQSVNFRAYTPTQWAGVPPKKEVTITMYNKMYISIDDGTTQLATIKAERGVPVTIDFSGSSETGNTLIALNTASMLQSISGLEQLYSDTCNFSAAIRLKELTIGSLAPGYQNALFNTLSLSNNVLLERLYVQNLTNANFSLDLSHCPALKYLDARGSGFTGYIFADSGKLEEAYLNAPSTIMMNNLKYITDENFHIISDKNLQYITINNCPQIDSFNRSLILNNLLKLELLNVNWRVQGIDFNTFVSHIKTIPNYLITGKVELTPEMGTFSVGKLGDTFTKDLKFYNYDTNIEFWSAEKNYLKDNKVQYNENIWISKGDNNIGNEPVENSDYWTLVGPMAQPYYTVSFYGLYHEWIRNQYIASGNNFIPDNFSDKFTETYINDYNIHRNPNWVNGADSRRSFQSWDKDYLIPVTSDLDVFAQEGWEYKLNYIMHTEDPNVFITNVFRYYAAGSPIEKMLTSEIPTFVRDYYLYSGNGWTKTNNTNQDPTASQILVPRVAIKEEGPETWYAVYTKQPNSYTVSVYNTDIYGKKQGEPLITLSKKVYSDNQDETRVLLSELNSYRPGLGNSAKDKAIYIDGTMYINDLNQTDESKRLYRFLTWQPYVPNNFIGLPVTGDMDILAKYYKTDDIFTNYFLNKITTCTLDDSITKLPDGAFLHNSNLQKITTKAQHLGKGCFSYFAKINNNESRRIFIFTATNINIGDYCFYNLSDSLIIFTGTGSISVGIQAFYELKRCIIIILNSNEPIHSSSVYTSNNFQNFYTISENQNYLYVTPEAYQRYINNDINDKIPFNLNGTEGPRNLILEINKTNPTFQNLLQEAGINDY